MGRGWSCGSVGWWLLARWVGSWRLLSCLSSLLLFGFTVVLGCFCDSGNFLIWWVSDLNKSSGLGVMDFTDGVGW